MFAETATRVLAALEARGVAPATVRVRVARGEALEKIVLEAGLSLRDLGLHRPHWPDFVAFHIFPGA